MNYLLDVNILVAWGRFDHVDHERTPGHCRGDALLLDLAAAHRAKLATLDAGIPGALLIPASVATRGGN